MLDTSGGKWEMIQQIQSQEQSKGKPRESLEPENSYQKMTTKYPAPKKEIVIVMWDMR